MQKSFNEKVFDLIKKIPKGKVSSYKEIAICLGNIKLVRKVAKVCSKNFNKKIPCHRVVMNNGKIGGYNRGVNKKIKKLEKEGIKIKNNKVCNLRKFFYKLSKKY